MGKQWKQCQTLFLGGSKITAEGDCSHEIKRSLLVGRKVMTNLDSIIKSKDITLPTKFCLVKAMVFPVVMYGCKFSSVQSLSRVRLITFLPRTKCLLISWLQSPSAVILEPPKNKVWHCFHCFHCFPIYFPWSDGTGCHDLCFLNVEL